MEKLNEKIASLEKESRDLAKQFDDAYLKLLLDDLQSTKDDVNSCCDFIKDVVSVCSIFFGVCFIFQMVMVLLHL